MAIYLKRSLQIAVPIALIWWISSEWLCELQDWPDPVIANNYQFCTLDNFANCEEGDWFGIYDSELPEFAVDRGYSSMADPRVVMCKEIGDPPSSSMVRFIITHTGESLRLCRLKSKDELIKAFDAFILN
jgi:hypothetical protein